MKNNRLESIITQSLERFYSRLMPILNSKQPKESGKGLTKNDLTDELKGKYDEAVNMSHGHANKNILDNTNASFTTTLKGNYDDAVNKSHTHSNKNILDNTNESFTTDIKTQINTNKSNISIVADYINDSDLITDSESKMVKTVPTNANHACGISMIGGKTQKVAQILAHGDMDGTGWESYSANTTLSFASNVATITLKSTGIGYNYGINTTDANKVPFIQNHVYLAKCEINPSVSCVFGYDIKVVRTEVECPANVYTTVCDRFTWDIASRNCIVVVRPGNTMLSGSTYKVKNVQIFDLTAMFGSGKEPTIEAFNVMFPSYIPYNEGELWNALVESVVSTSADGKVKTTLLIPDSDRNLPCFGYGINETVQNIRDYENGTYTQMVAEVDLGDLNWTADASYPNSFIASIVEIQMGEQAKIGNILCDKYTADSFDKTVYAETDKTIALGTAHNIAITDKSYTDATTFKEAMKGVKLVYELETPVITDCSDMLIPIRCESGGTITFNNEHNLDMPNSIMYKKEVSLS